VICCWLRIGALSAATALIVGVPVARAARLSAAAAATQDRSQGETPGRADAFVDAVGVDSHFNYNGTSYIRNWPAISSALIGSGIRHIRDGGKPEAAYLERLAMLGSHGIDHNAGFALTATPAYVESTLRTFAPYVDFVETQNEYDSAAKTDPQWADKVIAAQKTLYATVHGDSAFSRVTVLGPALARQRYYSMLGPLDAYEDAGNLHYSTCDDPPGVDTPRQSVRRVHALLRMSTQTKPIWTTEAGYNSDTLRPCHLPDDIIAKYDPRTVAERWNLGEPRIFFYQLADMPRDSVFGGTGLLHADGSPKPQFTALKSMIGLLADPGPAFAPSPLKYAIGGNTKDVHHTLLQKRNGRYELLVWLEVPAWKSTSADHRVGTPLDVRPQTISVTLPPLVASAKLYRYAHNWSLTPSPVAIRGGSAQFEVSDAISFLELSPR